MPKRGLFIAFEGIDGSGHTTQALKAAEYLATIQRGGAILYTHEPTNSIIGQKIRQIIRTQRDPYANARELLQLFIKDRELHVENVIKPALAKGWTVIADRYKYSTIAYQFAQGIPFNESGEANAKFPTPDGTFIIDTPVQIALKRTLAKKPKELFLQAELQEKIRETYGWIKQYMGRREKIFMIDGRGTPEQVFKRVKKKLDKLAK